MEADEFYDYQTILVLHGFIVKQENQAEKSNV